VPDEEISRTLVALGVLDEGAKSDDYAVLAAAENLALRLELPAPVAGEILRSLAAEDHLDFPEPPPEVTGVEEEGGVEGAVGDTGGTDQESVQPSPDDRADRRDARVRAERGEEPARVQDPQAKDAPGVPEEEGEEKPAPSPPESGAEDAPGTRS
jgi:hypothetical protein